MPDIIKALLVTLVIGVMFVTIIYIAYLLVPILVLSAVFFVAYLVLSEEEESSSSFDKKFKPPF